MGGSEMARGDSMDGWVSGNMTPAPAPDYGSVGFEDELDGEIGPTETVMVSVRYVLIFSSFAGQEPQTHMPQSATA
jgi:hypothetical protein